MNPHGLPYAPQTYASADSATPTRFDANIIISLPVPFVKVRVLPVFPRIKPLILTVQPTVYSIIP